MQTRYSPNSVLLAVTFILLGIGLVTIYSSSAIYALERFGSSTYFLWRQLFWILIALSASLFFSIYNHQKLKKWILPSLAGCFVLLIAVLIVGHSVGGAKRWLRIAGFGFQPSEFTKLALVLFTAYYCDKKRSRIHTFWKGLFPILTVIAILCGLILIQPDLGTPILIVSSCIAVLFVGGANLKQISRIGLVVLVLVSAAVWMTPYRRHRLLSFLNPWENPQGTSYQLVQSLIALGSGGLTGVGLGDSKSKLLYLPEPHTDFIFPILAEESGLLGSLAVLSLFGLLGWAGFKIASECSDLFGHLLASGITLLILFQGIFNIAVVTGCLPTKGMPLPLISFGGSSLVVTLSGIGILMNIGTRGPGKL